MGPGVVIGGAVLLGAGLWWMHEHAAGASNGATPEENAAWSKLKDNMGAAITAGDKSVMSDTSLQMAELLAMICNASPEPAGCSSRGDKLSQEDPTLDQDYLMVIMGNDPTALQALTVADRLYAAGYWYECASAVGILSHIAGG